MVTVSVLSHFTTLVGVRNANAKLAWESRINSNFWPVSFLAKTVHRFRSGAYEMSASQAIFPEKVEVIQWEVSAEAFIVDKAQWVNRGFCSDSILPWSSEWDWLSHGVPEVASWRERLLQSDGHVQIHAGACIRRECHVTRHVDQSELSASDRRGLVRGRRHLWYAHGYLCHFDLGDPLHCGPRSALRHHWTRKGQVLHIAATLSDCALLTNSKCSCSISLPESIFFLWLLYWTVFFCMLCCATAWIKP